MQLFYLREETPYEAKRLVEIINEQMVSPVGEISRQLDASLAEVVAFAERLKSSMDTGLRDDDEITVVKNTKDGYSFRFIGLYDYVDEDEKGTERNLTFFFLPKFVGESAWKDWEEKDESKRDAIRKNRDAIRDTVLQAIDRRNRELSKSDDQTEETDERRESLLERAVRVLRDYLENGVYTVQRRELEHNGHGEIDWETTIDQYQPVFLKKDGKPRPVYLDYATELAWSDEDHYITRLHQCLVTTWGRKLEELGLSSVLRVNVPLLSEEELDWFGEPDYQIAQIDKELRIQFVTKSRHTLSLMKDLIRETAENKAANLQSLSFGMNGAAQLWETAIKDVFGDQMGNTPNKLGLSCSNTEMANKPLKDFIGPPKWTKHNQQGGAEQKEEEDGASGSRLRPDFIAVDTSPSEKRLVILDAKYYLPQFGDDGKTISHCPGVGDIDKQFLYQLSFAELCEEKENMLQVLNAFVFPNDPNEGQTSKEQTINKFVNKFATINVPLFGWIHDKLPEKYRKCLSEEILALQVDGIALFKAYAEGRPLDPTQSRLKPILEVASTEPSAGGAA